MTALDAQVRERREREARERAEHEAAAAAARAAAAERQRLQAAAEEARRAALSGVDAFRHQQEAERAQAEAARRAVEEAEKRRELAAAQASPWLNEAPETAVSAADPRRFRPDHFKGLPPAQKQAILQTVAVQQAQHAAAQALAAAEAAAADARRLAAAATAQQLTAEAEAVRRAAAADAAVEQRRQAEEAARREAERNAFLKSQAPTPAYFAQVTAGRVDELACAFTAGRLIGTPRLTSLTPMPPLSMAVWHQPPVAQFMAASSGGTSDRDSGQEKNAKSGGGRAAAWVYVTWRAHVPACGVCK